MKSLFIVDHHHQVLTAWASCRSKLSHAPRLISLDHHTDTSRPFRTFLSKIKSMNESIFELEQKELLSKIKFQNEQSVSEAIKKLNNDEHIVAAISVNIVSEALIVAHNAYNTDLSIYKQHKIICSSVGEVVRNRKPSREDCDLVLESSFLDKKLNYFNKILAEAYEVPLFEKPFILDIDLDYFNTFRSLQPEDASLFKLLCKNAEVVTVATESEYVEHCSLDEGLTSGFALEKLKKLVGL